MNRYIYLALSIYFISIKSFSGELYTQFPKIVHADQKYVFYSHGLIVEGDNLMPKDERWGVYDFIAVRKALKDPNYNLISYHRPANTQAEQFADKLAQDVRKLLSHGVKPQNITLLGFSRGGEINLLASAKIRMDKINTILLAVCGGFVKEHEQYQAIGNVSSIFETSDFAGSCQFLQQRNNKVTSFREASITTGKEHGAFYRPLPQWLKQVKQWINNPQN